MAKFKTLSVMDSELKLGLIRPFMLVIGQITSPTGKASLLIQAVITTKATG
jgi:hypothetical protein